MVDLDFMDETASWMGATHQDAAHERSSSTGASSTSSSSDGGAAPLTTADAEDTALRPDDPADQSEPAAPATLDDDEGLADAGQVLVDGDLVGGDDDELSEVEPLPRPPASSTTSDPLLAPQQAASYARSNTAMRFGVEGATQQVKGIPTELVVELKRLLEARLLTDRGTGLTTADRQWLARVSLPRLITAFLAVQLGMRPEANDVDEQTAAIMLAFAGANPAQEALEQRMGLLADQVRLLRKEHRSDQLRARATERGVAVLVAERLLPTREALPLVAASLALPTHETVERLLRSTGTELVGRDRRSEGVRLK